MHGRSVVAWVHSGGCRITLGDHTWQGMHPKITYCSCCDASREGHGCRDESTRIGYNHVSSAGIAYMVAFRHCWVSIYHEGVSTHGTSLQEAFFKLGTVLGHT